MEWKSVSSHIITLSKALQARKANLYLEYDSILRDIKLLDLLKNEAPL